MRDPQFAIWHKVQLLFQLTSAQFALISQYKFPCCRHVDIPPTKGTEHHRDPKIQITYLSSCSLEHFFPRRWGGLHTERSCHCIKQQTQQLWVTTALGKCSCFPGFSPVLRLEQHWPNPQTEQLQCEQGQKSRELENSSGSALPALQTQRFPTRATSNLTSQPSLNENGKTRIIYFSVTEECC